MKIRLPKTVENFSAIRQLFQEYAAETGIDLTFQGFPEELACLPGAYSPPLGLLLIGTSGVEVAGCVALRRFSDDICEMKRMFVRQAYRGKGLGEALAKRVIEEARKIGYARVVLDTLPTMANAIKLYERHGFVRRSAYYETPLADTVFMELKL